MPNLDTTGPDGNGPTGMRRGGCAPKVGTPKESLQNGVVQPQRGRCGRGLSNTTPRRTLQERRNSKNS